LQRPNAVAASDPEAAETATGFKEEIRLVVAFTTGHIGTGRSGVKAGLKAEADPQIGKTNWLRKENRIYARFTRGQARQRAGVQRYKAGSSGPSEGW
jgi:hypothetical protein